MSDKEAADTVKNRIWALLVIKDRPLKAKEIVEAFALEKPSVGRTSVNRALTKLSKEGKAVFRQGMGWVALRKAK